MNKELECCTICPHNCKINRTKNPGRCKSTDKIKIALYSIHNFECPTSFGSKRKKRLCTATSQTSF